MSEDRGFCAGAGRQIDVESSVLITLAGFAYEIYQSFTEIDDIDVARARGGDFDSARETLAALTHLRVIVRNLKEPVVEFMDVDEALAYHLKRATDMLLPYWDLIERIGERLEAERRLSGRAVAAMCRELGKSEIRHMKEERNADTNA